MTNDVALGRAPHRRWRPSPAVSPAARGLVLGEQHRAVDAFTGSGARKQIGVGGAGFVDDVEGAPGAAPAYEFVADVGRLQWARCVVALHCERLGRISARHGRPALASHTTAVTCRIAGNVNCNIQMLSTG